MRVNSIRMTYVLTMVAISLTAAPVAASIVPIFLYDADASTASGSTPTTLSAGDAITDVSGGGENGTVIGATVSTVEDDPFSAAGQLSFSFTSGSDNRINTDSIDLLTVANVAAAGGFTMEVYIKTSQISGFAQPLAYAGTNGLRLNSGLVEYFALSDGGSVIPSTITNIETATGVELQDGAWHHLLLEFDAQGNGVVSAQVAGEAFITVDGGTKTSLGAGAFDDFGEGLNRSIGVGGRSAGGDQYTGLVYNPSVSLGIVPEPTAIVLTAISLLGLSLVRSRRNRRS